jgi:L-alanine-DL-glutamate epimerase-like enolase superfamily enzyme
VAAGENEFGVQGFRELIRAKAVDIVQPDVCRDGGISETVKIGKLAHAANLGVATHTWNDAVTIIANAHCVSAMPNGVTVEIDQTGNPFITDLLDEPLDVRDGQLQLPRRPGLGIRLNQSTIARYRMDDPLKIPDGLYSDMAFGNTASFAPAEPYPG